MKKCPVCNARCFDDMNMCFGCLHRFEEEDESTPLAGPLVLSAPETAATTGLIKPIGSSDAFGHPERSACLDVEEPSIVLPEIDALLQEYGVLDIQFESTPQAHEVGAASPNQVPETERSNCMLLVVDVGNTHTVLGLFAGQELKKTWRITTNKDSTYDEMGVLLAALFQTVSWSPEDVEGSALASVVPRLTETWRQCLFSLVGRDPVLCTAANAEGLFEADYPCPEEIGQDRVADVLAVRAFYGDPAIVVDFGTATNIEIIDDHGCFCGGIIAPGVETSMKALFSNASKLSMVDLDDPVSVIGKSTAHAIQSGIVFGEAERVDGLLRRIFEELGYEPQVIATGGLAGLMTQHSKVVSVTDQNLTLQGLRLLYEHVEATSC